MSELRRSSSALACDRGHPSTQSQVMAGEDVEDTQLASNSCTANAAASIERSRFQTLHYAIHMPCSGKCSGTYSGTSGSSRWRRASANRRPVRRANPAISNANKPWTAGTTRDDTTTPPPDHPLQPPTQCGMLARSLGSFAGPHTLH